MMIKVIIYDTYIAIQPADCPETAEYIKDVLDDERIKAATNPKTHETLIWASEAYPALRALTVKHDVLLI